MDTLFLESLLQAALDGPQTVLWEPVETTAIGTGALAAAYAFSKEAQEKNSVLVQMPGGYLRVKFNQQDTTLRGPAKFIFEGRLFK